MKKRIIAIVMSVMLIVTFIPCIAFAADKIDLSNAHVSGVVDVVGTESDFESEYGVCQPTVYDETIENIWDRLLEDVTLTIEGTSGRVEVLRQGEDFTVSYEDNGTHGTAKIIFTAAEGSEFTGSVSETFEIMKMDQAGIQASFSSQTFELGNTVTLDVERENIANGTNVGFVPKGGVSTNSSSLQAIYEGEYTVEEPEVEPVTYYRYNLTANKAGTYYVTISCPGNDSYFDNQKSYKITVNAKTKKIKVTNWNIGNYSYNGSAKKPNPVVKYGSKTLKKNTDYTVTYSNNVNASSSAKVIVKAKGKTYSGSATKTFTIKKGTQTIDVKISAKTLAPNGKTATIKQTAATKTKNVGAFSYSTSNKSIVTVKRDSRHNCTVTSKGSGSATVTITAEGTANLNKATKKVIFTVTNGTKKTAINKNMVLFTLPNGSRVTDISGYVFKKGVYPDVTMFPTKAKRDQAKKDGKMTGKLKYKTDWTFGYDTKAQKLTIWGCGDKYNGVLTYKYRTK